MSGPRSLQPTGGAWPPGPAARALQALLGVPAAPLGRVLAAAWWQTPRSSRWFWGVTLALAGAGLVAMAVLGPARAARGAAAVAAALVLLLLWGVQFSSLSTQNQPTAARLVPGHPRVLRRAAWLLWAVGSALAALALWAGLPVALTLPAWWLASAAAGVGLALLLRWWVLWLVVWALPPVAGAIGRLPAVQPVLDGLVLHWQAQPWLLSAAAWLGLAWALGRLFGDGGARHVASHRQLLRMQEIQRLAAAGQQVSAGAVLGPVGDRLDALTRRVSGAWLARLQRRAVPTPASVMARASVVLHGHLHWLRLLLGGLIVGLPVAAVVVLAVVWIGPHAQTPWPQAALGMGIGLCSALLHPNLMLRGALWQSRREQALLLLLPGMPRGAALNRAIAARQALQAGVAWVGVAAGLAALAQAADQALVGWLAVAALPLIPGWLWRPPARLRAPTAWTAFLLVLLHGAAALALHGLHALAGVPAAPLVVVVVVGTVVLAAWRWRVVSAAPQALPAGHLG